MTDDTLHIPFKNDHNPKAKFDLLKIEELIHRKNLDHSPFKSHIVQFYIILIIYDGIGYHTVDFTDYKCTKGTLITIRKDQINKFFKSYSIKGRLLLFTDEFLIKYLEIKETQKTMLLFNEFLCDPKLQLEGDDYNFIIESVKRIETEYFDVNDIYSTRIIRSELHILMNKLLRIKAKQKDIVYKQKYLKEFIQLQKLIEANVSVTNKVSDYAKWMLTSTKTLNSITRGIVHKSAKEFIDEICIKQTKRLLINTELNITEIAYEMGFNEPTNFYKYFKKKTGTTPDKFRSFY